jgi:uncharacterized membrane protein YdfJ with MMPL/SSD domain
MSASHGITGKAGRWSARHPWTAISLWVAFVAIAMVIGSAVGTKKLTEAESASGESGVAARALDASGFKIQPGEQVLVQSRTVRATDPAFRAVVADVVQRLDRAPDVVKLRSPYAQNTISKDGHSALVSFDPRHVRFRQRQGRADPGDDRGRPGGASRVHDRRGR